MTATTHTPFLAKDIESQQVDKNYLTKIRNGFIRKVYSIVLVQIISTTLITGLLITLAENGYAATLASLSTPLLVTSLLVTLGLNAYLLFRPDLMRKYPQNYWFLAAFTLGLALIVGFSCMVEFALGRGIVVVQALLITSFMFGGLTLYACQSKRDFTTMGGTLLVLLLALTGVSLISLLFPRSKIFDLIKAGAGAVLFGVYVIYDTQKILGKRVRGTLEGQQFAEEYSLDDYAAAALMLYVDIVDLFLSILRLVSGARED